ncbi:YdiU family protein [Corallincola platygyrae]|uniref:Protein nucleotidyltransferase YdiU n=1 Tax=Corallincola platygyrae TaxID=1193278 RepID=A0ABW4XLP6_9GAMM
MQLSNQYANLGEAFSQTIDPESVALPALLLWNQPLAEYLGIDATSPKQLATYFAGNERLPGSTPIACAYSGHQFGHFNPQLGDGRAHLLGELTDKQGNQWDLQLKGSGRTRFSRQGDGKCALSPALREYLMSEAMFALGVPTTRALAVVTTGEQVFREETKPGAVVTRVASSHLRVGTFQYFAARQDHEALSTLVDFAIARHYPELADSKNRALALLDAVIDKQITLITHWLRVGFIHGVMNTDNTAISGETIDFGPCAMLGVYHPGTVYSSIDSQGRYAFGNQATICRWNMARLAETLLPLIDEDEEAALAKAEALIANFAGKFEQAYLDMNAAKIGITKRKAPDGDLIIELLELMQSHKLDYTQTYQVLADTLSSGSPLPAEFEGLEEWVNKWHNTLQQRSIETNDAMQLMAKTNPVVIPRNHHVEAVLQIVELTGRTDAFDAFLEVLKQPYETLPTTSNYQDTPADGDQYYQTFCGT